MLYTKHSDWDYILECGPKAVDTSNGNPNNFYLELCPNYPGFVNVRDHQNGLIVPKMLQMKLAPYFKTSDDMKKSIFDQLTEPGSKAALPTIYDEDRVIGLRLSAQPENVRSRINQLARKVKWLSKLSAGRMRGIFLNL